VSPLYRADAAPFCCLYRFSEIQHHSKRWPFKVIDKNGEIAIEVQFKDQTTQFTPEEITGFMVQRMKETAEGIHFFFLSIYCKFILVETLDSAFIGLPVTEAVLTVPAHFTAKQRDALKKAADKANLKVLRFINEPTAAALAVNYEEGAIDKNIVVVDIGSSVSISIIQAHGGIFEVNAQQRCVY